MPELTFRDWNATVHSSAEEVLETMFFCSVFGQAASQPAFDAISARLRFEGDPSGTFTVGISLGAARLITANFLGLEPKETLPNDIEQVTSELASMMCGSILARNTTQQTFLLNHPEIVELTNAPPGALVVDFEIEDGFITTQLNFDTSNNGK